MKFIVCNAFSINMLERGGQDVAFVPVNVQAVRNLLKHEAWESAVGHADTAALFSAQLGREIGFNRISIPSDFFGDVNGRVPYNNQILAGVYSGPSLPEGSTTLPEGASIQWVLVTPVKMWGGEWHVAKEHKVTY